MISGLKGSLKKHFDIAPSILHTIFVCLFISFLIVPPKISANKNNIGVWYNINGENLFSFSR